MLNSQRPLCKDGSDPGGLTLEQCHPSRIVVDNQNAAVQSLNFSDVCGANLFLDHAPIAIGWLWPQVKMQELIEGTLFVAGETLSVDEAVLSIEVERGLESSAGTGLQRKTRVTSLAGLGDDVI